MMDNSTTYVSKIETIRNKLPIATLLELLGEESSELTKAALKKARILRGDNPTPVTLDEANDNLIEEYADVAVCGLLLGIELDIPLMEKKINRMAERLKLTMYDKPIPEIGYFQEGSTDEMVEDFDNWIASYVNKYGEPKKPSDLHTLAQTLCDDMPLGYECSLHLARLIFNGAPNE